MPRLRETSAVLHAPAIPLAQHAKVPAWMPSHVANGAVGSTGGRPRALVRGSPRSSSGAGSDDPCPEPRGERTHAGAGGGDPVPFVIALLRHRRSSVVARASGRPSRHDDAEYAPALSPLPPPHRRLLDHPLARMMTEEGMMVGPFVIARAGGRPSKRRRCRYARALSSLLPPHRRGHRFRRRRRRLLDHPLSRMMTEEGMMTCKSALPRCLSLSSLPPFSRVIVRALFSCHRPRPFLVSSPAAAGDPVDTVAAVAFVGAAAGYWIIRFRG